MSSGIVYDLWWNGSMRGAPDFHNMLGFLTETALYRYATPHCYGEDEIPETFGARSGFLPADRPTTQYPDPWEGGCWHIRDAMDYMMTASKAVMDHASKHRQDYLENIYLLGQRQIARGEAAEGGPFAYVMDPAAQHDPGALDELLDVFRTGGIEVRRAEAAFCRGRAELPRRQLRDRTSSVPALCGGFDGAQGLSGSTPVPRRAAGSALRHDRLRVEPADGDRCGPGHDTFRAACTPGRSGRGLYRGCRRTCRIHGLAPRSRAEQHGGRGEPAAPRRCTYLEGHGGADGRRRGAICAAQGTFVIEETPREAVDDLASELGLRFTGASSPPAGRLAPLHAPRIGIYRGHVSNMPEGWTRWVLDKYGFAHERVDNDRIRAGDLDGLDILIFPDQSASQILNGHPVGSMPPEFMGGVGAEGVAALCSWVDAGGWLMALDNAVDFAIDALELPVTNLVAGLPTEEFFIPGTLLHLDVDAHDPLAWGMQDEAIAFFVRSQSLEVEAGRRDGVGDPVVYARYGQVT